jgi:ATP-dependent protease ClpP protease subunit
MRDSLSKKGKLFLWGEIDHATTGKLYQELCYCQQEEIHPTIFICSDGGDVECGAGIVDKIIEMGADTCVVGKAYSMAGIILAAGVQRFAYPNSCVMFHSCAYQMHDSHENNMAYSEFCGTTYEDLMRTVCYNCEMSTRQTTAFLGKVKDSIWMNVKDAKRHKIITQVLGE